MQDLLNHYPLYFPKRNEEIYTLKQFLDNTINDKYNLPIIVNITSLNNYGRSLKSVLTKNTQLLLIDIYQVESIVAEYHRLHDGRHHHHSHRHRISLMRQGKMATKASTKFRKMKNLSKSLASLTTINQINNSNNNDDDDDYIDNEDDSTYKQRILVKSLNERRSSSIPLCRIPIDYQGYFELLNENDQPVEPYHKLTDLMITEYDDNHPERPIEKWPHAFLLRSSCVGYTKKSTSELLQTTTNSTASNDSCYSSSSEFDSQKNPVILDDEIYVLQPGQILTILGDCFAQRTRISDKEQQQLQSPSTPPSPTPAYLSASWIKDKSKMFFSKKRRQSQPNDVISNEIVLSRTLSKISEHYLKCQTQQGDIVYISLQESGLFSPLNIQTHRLNSMDISGVFQLQNIISNFRFPISVRPLDGSISFDTIYSSASINRHETPTKLRLLMPYNEDVIYTCPLNIVSSKSSKTSAPFIIPLSINADIEIQPCLNMDEISQTEDFRKLIEIYYELIGQYQNEISLIHYPLQFTNNKDRQKPLLNKTRSQSESYIDHYDDNMKEKYQRSDEQLNCKSCHTETSLSSVSSPLRYRDSLETIKQKLTTDAVQQQTSIGPSSYNSKIKNDKQKQYSQEEYTSEDEIYKDVDKIYDYIRSGDITDDVQKIQAKEKRINNIQQMMTNRFSFQTMYSPSLDHHYPCTNDNNVDSDQAHELYLASKQGTKTNSPDLLNPKPIIQMKRINKH